MEERSTKNMSILMLPWLAHGHISPFLELSKRLSDRNITIYFCSTSINLNPIKEKLSGTKYSLRILPVELRLPDDLPGLPPHLHTTKHLPPHLMPTLKTAFDLSEKDFADTLRLLRPDLVVYDFLQHWAPTVAVSLGIPAVEFLCMSAAMCASAISFMTNPPRIDMFPFLEIYLRDYEQPGFVRLLEGTANGIRDGDRFKWCSERSVGVILIKSFRDIEAKCIDYLEVQLRKKVVPVGPLVEEDHQHDQNNEGRRCKIIEWLDKKPEKSTVFVSFGSEYFLSKEEIIEIAHGLEQNRVNFIWVIRFHGGGECQRKIRAILDSIEEALPEGFLGRVGDRGYVTEWAPQIEILRHPSTGGFLSHCGWSSVMEAMKFGVPIVAMPMHLDQPINARLVVEGVGDGLEVERDGEGQVRREEVARKVRSVVVERAGERVRRRAQELRDLMVMRRERGLEDEEIDSAVDELLQVCGKINNNLVKSEERENINHRLLVPN